MLQAGHIKDPLNPRDVAAANSGDIATIQAGGQAASSRREGVVNSGSYQRGQGQSGK